MMDPITRYKLEFSAAPLAVVAIGFIAAYAVLGETFWKALVLVIAAVAIKPAVDALWAVWAGKDDDDDSDDTPQQGAPVGPMAYEPVMH